MTATSELGCVHLIDDDSAIRDATSFLMKTVGIDCECYESAQDFLSRFTPDPAACFVIDIRMPGMSGLDLQAELGRQHITNPIVFITGHGEVEMAVRAMRDGAFDFIQKPFRDQDLLDSINAGLRQAQAASASCQRQEALAERFENLSPRERQVMALVAAGKANKVIAYELGVSQRTVEIHRARVMQKMAAKNLAELVRTNILLEEAGIVQ